MTPTPWPSLRLHARRLLPAFPVTALPEWVQEQVTVVAQEARLTTDAPSLLTLAAIGAAAAKRVEVNFGMREIHHVNLWALAVLPRSEGKGPLIRAIARPFRRVQQEHHHQFDAGEIDRRTDLRILHSRSRRAAAAAATFAANGDDANRENARRGLREIESDIARLEGVRETTLIVEDSTPEALVRTLADNAGVATMVSDEGSILFSNALRSANEDLQNIEHLLKSHCAEDIHQHRISRPALVVRSPALSILIATQPSVVRGLIRRGAFRDRGLWERFLFVTSPSTVGHRDQFDGVTTPLLPGMYSRTLSAFLSLPVLEADDAERRALRCDGEAEGVLNSFFHEVDVRMKSGDLSEPSVQGWAGKLRATTIRIAAVLHLADAHEVPSTQPHDPSNFISVGHAVNAISIARWAMEQAREFLVGDFDQDDDVAAVVAWIRRRRLTVVRPRDIQHGLGTRFTSRDILDRTIAAIVEAGALRPREGAERRTGRPPVEYEVHPDLLATSGSDDPPRQNDESAGHG